MGQYLAMCAQHRLATSENSEVPATQGCAAKIDRVERSTLLLRYSLGNEFLKIGAHGAAIAHLPESVKLDAEYSAAWKMLGKALASSRNHTEAVDVLAQGIEMAEQRGDIQAA